MSGIRLATSDDADLLSRLGAETFTESFGHLYKPEDLAAFLGENHSPEAYASLLTDPKARAWIAETADGEAIGFATVCPCKLPAPDLSENAGELKRFYFLKAHQGAGLGSQMLEDIFRWADQTFDQFYVSVWSENHGAIRLYERFGFVKVHEYRFMVGDQADLEFIMMQQRD